MKRIVLVLLIALFLVKPFCLVCRPPVMTQSYTDVTVQQANAMIASNPSLVILDVRTQSEYDSGHIKHALLIPDTELSGRLDELNQTDHILVYCRLGGRSSISSQLLVDHGFEHVYNMLGGITAWTAEDYPVYVKYSSIQEAINNATAGDVILISQGTYYEHVIVNKTVSLIGENRDTTIFNATTTDPLLHVLAENVLISQFTMWGYTFTDVYVNASLNTVLIANRIVFNGVGIYLAGASNNTVENNTFEGMGLDNIGIFLEDSSECTVRDNTISGAVYDGIRLHNSNVSLIQGNLITDNDFGIFLYGVSNDNTVTGCTISDNSVGISIDSSTHTTKILANTITNNYLGINLEMNAHNVSVAHNNIMINTLQTAIDAPPDKAKWNNTLEGNYWSDYSGSDANHDGIGDQPYPVTPVPFTPPELMQYDYYPLMGMFSTYNTFMTNVNVISNSTIQNFTYHEPNGTIRITATNMSANQTFGFCRIAIPKNLISPPYTVIVDNESISILYFNDSIHDNSTHRWIYFAFAHSTREIVIMPEHWNLLMIVLLGTATAMTAKRKPRSPNTTLGSAQSYCKKRVFEKSKLKYERLLRHA